MVEANSHLASIGCLLLAVLLLSCTGGEVATSSAPVGEPIPVIWDDDGSIDGVTGLLYLLEHPSYEVRLATVSPGIAHPSVFAPKLAAFLELLGAEDIPVAAGAESPLAGDNAFPPAWRSASDGFWGVDLPETSLAADGRTAAEVIVEVARSSEQPVIIFASGPLTNVALALRLDPEIADRIGSIEVMGGALEVGGNVWQPETGPLPAEWNIYIDPTAASEVLASGVEIRLTPLDATDEIRWRASDAEDWQASDNPVGAMAARLLKIALQDGSSSSALIWDLVAAINVSDRGLCQWRQVQVEVGLERGRDLGRTVLVPEGPANVTACLSPRPSTYKRAARGVFAGAR